MNTSAALRAFMSGSIDYAGLFPPASLQLEPALMNYATYLSGDDAWMLSTFVLPLARFADAAWFLSEFNQEKPLRISVLGPKTMNATDFQEELKNIRKGVREFVSESHGVVQIEQLEMPLPSGVTPEANGDLRSFWEAAAADAERVIELLAHENSRRETSAQDDAIRR